MKEFSKDEYNRLCAEFLGAIKYIPKPWYMLPQYSEHWYFSNRHKPNRFTDKMLRFDSDWNWIMEVITKMYSHLNPSSSLKQDLIRSVCTGNKDKTVWIIWEFLNNQFKYI